MDCSLSIDYCCTGGGALTSDFSLVTKPDPRWGNSNSSSGFDSDDDFVGVDIQVNHNHSFLLPINWAKDGGIVIRSRARIYMVQYAP